MKEMMIGGDIDDEVTDEVNAIETNRVLLGYLDKFTAIQWQANSEKLRNPSEPPQFSQEDMVTENHEKVSEYVDAWKEAQSNIASSNSHEAHKVDLQELPDTDGVEEHLDAFKDTPHFEQVVGNVPSGDWSIQQVPLESIVAIQPSVGIDAYQDIPTAEDDYADLLEYCLPLSGDQLLMDQTIQTPGNSLMGYQLVSRGPNIQVSGMELDRDSFEESGAVAVRFEIRPRINFVQVVNYGNRLILKNGYHRCFQLLDAGVSHVPAFVRGAQNYGQTGGQKPGFFNEDTVTGSNPPMLTDFFTDAAVDLETAGTNKVIRVLAETTDIRR